MKKVIAGLIISLFLISGIAFAIQVVDIAPLTYKVLSSATTVTTTAAAVPASQMMGRRNLTIRLNTVTDVVYIGSSTVTVGNGFKLDGTVSALTMDIDDSVIVYAVCSAGTVDLRTLETK